VSAFLAIVLVVLGFVLLAEPALAALVGQPSQSRWPNLRAVVGVVLVIVGTATLAGNADASTPVPTLPVTRVVAPTVPAVSARYRLQLEHVISDVFGDTSPVARIAAQIHQESLWQPQAQSGVGAQGLGQFMPATGRWLAGKFPDVGPYDPWDPEWSIRALATYDDYLLKRHTGDTACASWAFMLASYNGGEAALRAERRAARAAGLDDGAWFANVETRRARSQAAWQENRGYVRRILLMLEPMYVAAGWPGATVCA
jgi:soluble lytic murein transglycosylase-like protein